MFRDGLTAAEVAARFAAGRVNLARPAPGRTVTQILRANLLTRFNAILGALLVVVAIVGPAQDALFGIVLVSNAAIGIFQELRTKRSLDRLAVLTTPKTHVVRDGVSRDIDPGDVVLDDVVELFPGDQVPVDGWLIETRGIEIDEAQLTGEAAPVPKVLGERVLSGTFVTSGSGRIRAQAVGADSYAGRLESEARRFSLTRSELQQGTNRILRLVTWVMVPIGVLLVVTELVRTHQSVADALRGSVAGVGAMVPEGLVLLTSIAFAVGALRLARQRVLIQELAAIEGLARVDLLCIDKTGTLTDAGLALHSMEPLGTHARAELGMALAAIAANETAPNATVRAIAAALPGDPGWTLRELVPFSSVRRWSAYGFEGHGTWVLGAPEALGMTLSEHEAATLCDHQSAGLRVVLVASSRTALKGDGRTLPEGLAPAAILAFEERLRPDAADTIAYLLAQGITIKVLSGDSPLTVGAVGRAVGVPPAGEPVDASRLDTDEALAGALETTNILGRVGPEQKPAAVRILQERGHVVAMLGDGVNDVRALKQADLGIAMGAGSGSSRAVARIVLLDSGFSAVPRVLQEGRKVIANIERVANLFVTKTVYAVLLAAVVVVGAVPFPFFPRHLTLVTTFTIGAPGLFLALASRAPRAAPGFAGRVLRFTIPTGAVAAAACFSLYAVCRATPHTSASQSRTAATLALLGVGIWVLALVSRPLNPPHVLLLAAMVIGSFSVFAVPLARRVLSLQIPPPSVLLLGLVIVLAACVLMWLLLGLSERYGWPTTRTKGKVGDADRAKGAPPRRPDNQAVTSPGSASER